jgi:type VI secretion system VasD/TssJ family lipoprotein
MRRRTAALVAGLAFGCGGAPDPVGFCVDIQGARDLNVYDGQAHVVTLYLYALASSQGFRQLTADDLLGGAKPTGMLENEPRTLTVGPGQILAHADTLPPETREIGVVADYYRASGGSAGERKVVLPADCGMLFKPSLVLASSGLSLDE